MAPFRLRHPKGVSTLQLDPESATVQDLLQAIFAVSEIPPSAQDLKAGYPPRSLTAVIPELPLSSLGLAPGDQLIVVQKSGSATPPGVTSAAPSLLPANPNPHPPPAARPTPSSNPRQVAPVLSTAEDDGPDYVEVDGGYLIHRVVPDDNSCMFASIALVFEQDMRKAPRIRQSTSPRVDRRNPGLQPSHRLAVVAEAIRRDPETWTDVILGRPRDEYIRTILSPNSWGGAIELTILAAHYRTEIASIDVETGRIDRFGTNNDGADAGGLPDSESRVLLVYSGIHYDAAVLAPAPDAPQEFCASVVPAGASLEGERVVEALRALAAKLRAKRAYTNTATFDLKCEVCGQGLKGEKEARAHASETGHIKFGEY
ncbi:OTU-domain-containing protein [Russula ochroleuca]|uniref:Ubiquitin thioesterase OTU n=1 Tax=Russula ochroleuca TaxID=152965 RepID=A0A9P5MTG1_9AGAM|nr:OTU-domain-containing protein [Russula ochroleuca]